jgi:hypothetical protein
MKPAEEESELDGDRQKRGEEADDGWLGECEIVEWHGLASLAIARMKKNS